MKIVDLSQPLYDGMDVYQGDPEVHIEQVHHLDKEGWRLKYLQLSSHTGTHADAFSHMDGGGITIDNISIDNFIGKTVMVDINHPFPEKIGLAFKKGKLNLSLLEKIKSAKPLIK